MYLGIKHSHVLLALISVSFLVVRTIWLIQGSALLQKKWVKILPHTIDTLLLAAAVTMTVMAPWLEQPWLWEKLILVVMYIAWGFYIFKFARTNAHRVGGLVSALLCAAAIYHLARTKVPFIIG